MQSGDLLTGDVSQYHSRILVNGVERPHASWDIGRALNGDLPAQVVAGAGITQATGTIQWAKEQDVSEREIHPWSRTNGWPPKSGDRVEIYAGDGTNEYRVFTGRIDETTGDVGSGMESSIVDDIDRLNVRFSHDPLLRVMPPRFRGDPDRGIGLSSVYYVDAALRKAGFYATPKLEPRPVVSVPAQGSMWPEVGILEVGQVGGVVPESGSPWATRHIAPWGYSIANVVNSYGPRLKYPMSEGLQFTMMVAPDHDGNAFFTAYYGADDITLSVAASGTVDFKLNDTTLCTLILNGATIVTGHTEDGVWTLRTNNGGVATATQPYPSTAVMEKVRISADETARVAGFQISHNDSTSYMMAQDHAPSARFIVDLGSFQSTMDACPAIQPTKVVDLLKEISEATCSAMWIDEFGVFTWAGAPTLRNTPSSQTITTLDDIRSLSWQDSLLSVRSGVDVDHRKPAITAHRWDNVVFHQGSGGTMESEERSTEFLEPEADVDWIGMSPEFSVIGVDGGGTAANRSQGSVAGAVLIEGDTETNFTDKITVTLDPVTPGTWVLKHIVGTLTSTQHLILQYPSESTSITFRHLNDNLPIIRGFAKTEWRDATSTPPITGPDWAPVLVHNAGPWNARTDNNIVVDRIAEYLADQVTKPAPEITGMAVNFDPRRQLGDVITVVSENLLGLELVCLIVDIQNTADGSYTQTLGVRIISSKVTTATFGEFESAYADDLTFSQWRAIRATTDTFADFNNDPLEGATL